jgi:hypothetical protein
MKVQEQDVFHGPGLVQIVEHQSFKALNRGSEKYGHYLINADRHVFAKYSKKKTSPWSFTFGLDDLQAINDAGSLTYVMLACGHVTLCALTLDELTEVIDLKAATAQTVTVEVPKRGSCHVKGSKGRMKLAVPHSAFPEKLFA